MTTESGHGLRGEDLRGAARPGEPVFDVLPRLVLAERQEAVQDLDALPDLPHVLCAEPLIQLGLCQDDDLDQLRPARLEVGHQPQLLDDLVLHPVRVVEEQHDVAALLQAPDQVLVERVQKGPLARLRGADSQLPRQFLEQHVIPVMGVRDEDRLYPFVEPPHRLPGQMGLPHAPLADDNDVALSFPDAVEHGGQRLLVRLRWKQDLAVGVLPEGHPAEPVVLRVIHAGRSACRTERSVS